MRLVNLSCDQWIIKKKKKSTFHQDALRMLRWSGAYLQSPQFVAPSTLLVVSFILHQNHNRFHSLYICVGCLVVLSSLSLLGFCSFACSSHRGLEWINIIQRANLRQSVILSLFLSLSLSFSLSLPQKWLRVWERVKKRRKLYTLQKTDSCEVDSSTWH